MALHGRLRLGVGLVLLATVVFLWVASSELTKVFSSLHFPGSITMWFQFPSSFLFASLLPFRLPGKFIFKEQSFNKPCFLTYVDSCSFIFYLYGFACMPSWRALHHSPPSSATQPVMSVPELLRWAAASQQKEKKHKEIRNKENETKIKGIRISPATHTKAFTSFVRESINFAGIAAVFVGLWFLANYTYNLSLNYTSVASNTILSSTSVKQQQQQK
jgi:hypothetical protein